MCFQLNHEKKTRDLTFEDITTIFDQNPMKSVFLIGGEIFVRKDIYQILDYLNRKGMSISFLSNGTLLNDEGIEKLIGYERLEEVWFSVDGLEDVHDKIRGKGAFRKVTEVIKKLSSHKKVNVNCVIMQENVDQLEHLLTYVEDLGVNLISYQFKMIYSLQQYQETLQQSGRLGCRDLMYDDCVRENIDLTYMKALREKANRLKRLDCKTKINFFPEVLLENLDEYIDGSLRTKFRVVCNDFVDSRLKIGPRGELLLCESMKYSPGNLLENTVEELWNNDEMKRWRKNLCNNNMLEMCTRCCGIDVIR